MTYIVVAIPMAASPPPTASRMCNITVPSKAAMTSAITGAPQK